MIINDKAKLHQFYQHHLEEVLLPFWIKAVDSQHGGVYTCFNNAGTELISKDKYTWSQGRFLWLWSRLYDRVRGDQAEEYLEQATKTWEFLDRYAVQADGVCRFLLTETGEPKEAIPGEGHDLSFYADCFVVLGFMEFARVTRNFKVAERALYILDSILHRLAKQKVRSEPYPLPPGVEAQAFSMIMLNVTQEAAIALKQLGHPRSDEMNKRSIDYMNHILQRFQTPDHLIAEMYTHDENLKDTKLLRHVNPGHTLECMWFVMTTALENSLATAADQAVQVIKRAVDIGWDNKHGGLFRYVDRLGGEPQGRLIGEPMETLISDTWDSKIWWPHSEALYSLAMAYQYCQDPDLAEAYERFHEYTFKTFPHPDREIGEWIQIRDRQGDPIDKVVALPVKDPYHIMRNVLLMIDLTSS